MNLPTLSRMKSGSWMPASAGPERNFVSFFCPGTGRIERNSSAPCPMSYSQTARELSSSLPARPKVSFCWSTGTPVAASTRLLRFASAPELSTEDVEAHVTSDLSENIAVLRWCSENIVVLAWCTPSSSTASSCCCSKWRRTGVRRPSPLTLPAVGPRSSAPSPKTFSRGFGFCLGGGPMGMAGSTQNATRPPLGSLTKMRIPPSGAARERLPDVRSGIASPRGSIHGRTGTPLVRLDCAELTEVASVRADRECRGERLRLAEEYEGLPPIGGSVRAPTNSVSNFTAEAKL
mmetsp:Transcript_16467/g.42529  ORF Transcript_16467/g.42529 Transcript_16467/m.42529 type:complete len:291 (+) Transcript_16467:331-1203(+)